MKDEIIISRIEKMIARYEQNHLCKPHYIKLPEELFPYIMSKVTVYPKVEGLSSIYTLCGLQVCLTKSLDYYNGIEVF